MQSVSFKSSIICSFVTVMVVFLLTFMCDLKSRRKIEELETQNKYSQTKIQDIEGQRRKIEELETKSKNSQTKIQDLEGQIYNLIKLYKKYLNIPGLLEDTKREIAEKLKYEDQLNVFLTNLRSNGEIALKCIRNIDVDNDFKFNAEIGEIQKFTEQDVSTLTNDDAKTTFFRLLSLPLQSICK